MDVVIRFTGKVAIGSFVLGRVRLAKKRFHHYAFIFAKRER